MTEEHSSSDGRASPAVRALLVTGGSLLAAAGLKRFTPAGCATAALGAALVYRGARAPQHVSDGIGVTRAITIKRSRDDVYSFWRDIDRLPLVMAHISRVSALDDTTSNWSFDVPWLDKTLEFNAEIVADEPGRLLAWRSLPGSAVAANGEVRFEDSPRESGTELYVTLSYRPPAGSAGLLAGKLISPAFERMVREDIRRVKHVLEAGEIPTNDVRPMRD